MTLPKERTIVVRAEIFPKSVPNSGGAFLQLWTARVFNSTDRHPIDHRSAVTIEDAVNWLAREWGISPEDGE